LQQELREWRVGQGDKTMMPIESCRCLVLGKESATRLFPRPSAAHPINSAEAGEGTGGLSVTEGDGQSVGGVGRRRAIQRQ
jgi:hypothetical protein